MSAEKDLSLHFYTYLCQKIGTEEEVKVRRLTYVIDDLRISSTKATKITSGSRGEGLQLNGSDLDIMYIDPLIKVYESDRDIVPQSRWCIQLVMNNEDTPTCFTQLNIVNNYDLIFNPIVNNNLFVGKTFSSELYKLLVMEETSDINTLARTSVTKIHGPCISSLADDIDIAPCLKCDKWISRAYQWIIRPRTTWPSPDLISRIISCGVLFVPIGNKETRNENLQWRISFSVAEKFLIFSFSHTQLLCYALLKIMVKEIVEKHDDLKTLLCSYFLKTLMFWISEESDPSMWRPDKIIPCFMACLKRLIYCVEYSTLLHYFIPDYNLFYMRFDVDKKDKMERILKNLFEKGIYSFSLSETLFDLMTLPVKAMDSPLGRRVALLHEFTNSLYISYNRTHNLLYHFVHHSRSKISRSIFFVILSFAYQNISQISQDKPGSNNKHKYHTYKHELSHLLIGTNSDAVGGWLVLASFFYVHENYFLSLNIVNDALMKCTNEKIYPWQIRLNQTQESLLNLLKRTELCTILKTIRIKYLKLLQLSPISLPELQLNRFEQHFPFHPIVFAHFLSFLCYYHLHKQRSYIQSLLLLQQTIIQPRTTNQSYTFDDTLSSICLGICYQMIGDTHSARQCFLKATQIDPMNLTSAAMRLYNCNID